MSPDAAHPVGGVFQMYAMVDGLNELGLDARVWHASETFRCDWFESGTLVTGGSTLRLEAGDVLVVPEYKIVAARDRLAGAAVVVLNQSHFGTFVGAGIRDEWPGAYPGLPNAVCIIATSEAVDRFVTAALRAPLPVFRVRCPVDGELFRPGPKRKIVAFTTSRSPGDLEAAVQLLHRSPVLVDWELRVIEGMTHEEVASTLNETAIFVSLSDREGFGRPSAEAMAAGCYVVGFTGGGGDEFMSPAWCSPIPFPNLLSLVEEVGRVAGAWSDGGAEIEAATVRAREFVCQTYDRQHFLTDTENAFSAILGPDSLARQPASVEVRHFDATARLHRYLAPLRPWVPDGVVRSVRSARGRLAARRP